LPGVGVLSLANTNAFTVLSGFGCPSGVCEATEPRILAELTPDATPSVALTGLECHLSEDMDNLIYDLQTKPACTPVPRNVVTTSDGINLNRAASSASGRAQNPILVSSCQ